MHQVTDGTNQHAGRLIIIPVASLHTLLIKQCVQVEWLLIVALSTKLLPFVALPQ